MDEKVQKKKPTVCTDIEEKGIDLWQGVECGGVFFLNGVFLFYRVVRY